MSLPIFDPVSPGFFILFSLISSYFILYLDFDLEIFELFIEAVEDELGVHNVIRYRPPADTGPKWKPSQLEPGKPLRQPGPLFKKLDESIVEEERARLGK